MSSPAAWHADPTGRHEHRYWDGERWTEHVADAGVASTDPLAASGDGGSPSTSSDASTAPGDSGAGPGASGDATGGTERSGPAMSPIEPSPDSSATSEPTYGATSPGASSAPYAAPSDGSGAPPSYGAYAGGGFPASSPVDTGAPQGSNPMAVFGMVLGILSIVFCWVAGFRPVGTTIMVLIAIAALVLSIVGKVRAGRGRKGNGMAIAGIITGAIGFILILIVLSISFFVGQVGGVDRFLEEVEWMAECMEETGDQEYCEEEFERRLFEELNE